jgi:hypothetical protein
MTHCATETREGESGAVAREGDESALAAEQAPAAGQTVLRGASAIIPQELVSEGEVVLLAIKPSLWFILLTSGRWLIAALVTVVACVLLSDFLAGRQ